MGATRGRRWKAPLGSDNRGLWDLAAALGRERRGSRLRRARAPGLGYEEHVMTEHISIRSRLRRKTAVPQAEWSVRQRAGRAERPSPATTAADLQHVGRRDWGIKMAVALWTIPAPLTWFTLVVHPARSSRLPQPRKFYFHHPRAARDARASEATTHRTRGLSRLTVGGQRCGQGKGTFADLLRVLGYRPDPCRNTR